MGFKVISTKVSTHPYHLPTLTHVRMVITFQEKMLITVTNVH